MPANSANVNYFELNLVILLFGLGDIKHRYLHQDQINYNWV